MVANGEEIYGRKLRFADAKARVERCYRPYHAALSAAVGATHRRFGRCLLIDCHSMPSIGGPQERDAGRDRVDFVLGDCFASACAPSIVERVERVLKDQGFVVARNSPYAGGYVTQHYGRPSAGVHALQIEINRALYLNEHSIAPGADFELVQSRLGQALQSLMAIDVGGLRRDSTPLAAE